MYTILYGASLGFNPSGHDKKHIIFSPVSVAEKRTSEYFVPLQQTARKVLFNFIGVRIIGIKRVSGFIKLYISKRKR